MSRSFPLLALPPDLLSELHQFLSPSTLLTNLATVSRNYRDWIVEDQQLWKCITQQRFTIPDFRYQSDDEQPMDEAPWFKPISSSSSSSSCSTTNPWLLSYRCFVLTHPRPLRLQILHVDDENWVAPIAFDANATDEARRAQYSIHNILMPMGKAYCSRHNRNVHVILALAPSKQKLEQDEKQTKQAELQQPLLQSENSQSSLPSSTSSPLPLPSTFLITDFKIIAPAKDYTSPLSSGFLFFSDTLPTPADIQAWDDWSEAQWIARQEAMDSDATRDERLSRERAHGIEIGELRHEVSMEEGKEAEDEELLVEDWYADVPMPVSSPDRSIPAGAYPLQFQSSDDSSSSPTLAFSQLGNTNQLPLAPVAAFFRIEDHGKAPVEAQPAHETNPAPASTTADATTGVFTVPTTSMASSSSCAPAAAASNQLPYSYRHHFPRPLHGRFLTLTFLRSSKEKVNIDVSYFGVKGYRKGMHPTQPIVELPQVVPNNAEQTSNPMVDASSSTLNERGTEPSPDASVAVAIDPDAIDDAFDFDAPLLSVGGNNDVATRLRAYLANLQRMGETMQQEVGQMDQHLAHVQSIIQAQQRAQQEQQTLRLRMLLLQTQQLQLQLQNQQLQTQATLAHASSLNERAAVFMQQRREVLSAVEQEREDHRRRLQALTEEKEREERLLISLRARVAEAREREDNLRSQLAENQAARERLNVQRTAASASTEAPQLGNENSVNSIAQPSPVILSHSVHPRASESRHLSLDEIYQLSTNRSAPSTLSYSSPDARFRASEAFVSSATFGSQTSIPAAAAAAAHSLISASPPTQTSFSVEPSHPITISPDSAGGLPPPTVVPSSSVVSSLTARTNALLDQLRASRLQRESEQQLIQERAQARREAARFEEMKRDESP